MQRLLQKKKRKKPKEVLKKDEILSLKKRISSTFENKKSLTCYPLKIFYQVHHLNSNSPAQVLFTVPKRNFKLAVDRNLLRRRIKEAYRKNKYFLHSYLEENQVNINLIIIYIHKQKVDYEKIEQQLILSLKKIIHKIDNQ